MTESNLITNTFDVKESFRPNNSKAKDPENGDCFWFMPVDLENNIWSVAMTKNRDFPTEDSWLEKQMPFDQIMVLTPPLELDQGLCFQCIDPKTRKYGVHVLEKHDGQYGAVGNLQFIDSKRFFGIV